MLLTTSTWHTWRAELRRAVLSWRTALLATALATHLSLEIDHLHLAATLLPGARGALAYASNHGIPLVALALAAGTFAAFGLVEDFAFGRLAYARQRAGSARPYATARTLAPAIGLATAVVVACVLAEGFAFLRFPPQPLGWRPELGAEPWPPLEIGPLTADVAFAGLLALVTAVLGVLAGLIARAGRQLGTLLLPVAFVVIAPVLLRGPLALLNPVEHAFPSDPPELAAGATYWLVLGVLALVLAVTLARPTPGRTDA